MVVEMAACFLEETGVAAVNADPAVPLVTTSLGSELAADDLVSALAEEVGDSVDFVDSRAISLVPPEPLIALSLAGT
jgi:hypothetical protein